MAESRRILEQFVFDAWLQGKTRIGDTMMRDCLNNPIVYGNVMRRIVEHKKKEEEEKEKEKEKSTAEAKEKIVGERVG